MGSRAGRALRLAAMVSVAGGQVLWAAAPGSPLAVGAQPRPSWPPTSTGTERRTSRWRTPSASRCSSGTATGASLPLRHLRSPPPPTPHLLAAGDLDGDGRLDLVATSHDSHGVFVWLGRGGGRFVAGPGSPFPALAAGKPHNHGLALGDLDGDGHLDVATADDEANVVAVLLGDGRGGFRRAPGAPFRVGREPYPLALGDVNGDGRLDAVVPNLGSASLSVLLGDGRGGLAPAPATPIGITARPYFVALADLNGDGTLDAVTTHDDVALVTALLGDGRGGFRLAPGSPFDVGRRPWKAVVHDADGDGQVDLVLATGRSVVALFGDGGGRFRWTPEAVRPAGRGVWSVAVGDFDGDGRADVAAADEEAGTLRVLLSPWTPRAR